jgi:hypothetical protein
MSGKAPTESDRSDVLRRFVWEVWQQSHNPDDLPELAVNALLAAGGALDRPPSVTLTFHPFPQVQPPGGKELLLITSSKVFRKGDLYGGKQWRIEGDPGWNGKEYEYALKSLSDVIFWAELPDVAALANHSGAALGDEALPRGELTEQQWREAEAEARADGVAASALTPTRGFLKDYTIGCGKDDGKGSIYD